MTKKFSLEAAVRASEIKRPGKGHLFAVVYGPGSDNKSLTIKQTDFEKVYEQAGGSSLIDLKINGGPALKVIIKDIQRDVLRHQISHADLFALDMSQDIEVETPLNFIGIAVTVANLSGTLIKEREELPIKCSPDKLPEMIDVDISVLTDFNDNIKAGDVKLPEGVVLDIDPSVLVAYVAAPRSAEPEDAEAQTEEAKTEETKEAAAVKNA